MLVVNPTTQESTHGMKDMTTDKNIENTNSTTLANAASYPLKMEDELDHPANLDIEGITKAVPYEYAIQFEILLRELMTVSAPYLKRKKETPRSQCTKLNEIHQKVNDLLG